jgi:hypothetical protein
MIRDPEYIAGIDWGTKRRGHPEGKVLAHIQDLSDNLSAIHSDLTPGQEAQIKIFIHTHDTFKGESVRGVPINHPQSHASLARAFVERYIGETNLSAVIQNHDEFYALWRAEQSTGILDKARYNKLVEAIHDWNLFLTCMIIDGVTPGKDITPVKWSTEIVAADARISLNFSPSDRLNKLLVALQRSP